MVAVAVSVARPGAGAIHPPRVRCPSAATLTFEPDEGRATKQFLRRELLPPAISFTATNIAGEPLTVGAASLPGGSAGAAPDLIVSVEYTGAASTGGAGWPITLPIGAHRVLYQAVNADGDAAYCHATVTVADAEPPKIVCDRAEEGAVLKEFVLRPGAATYKAGLALLGLDDVVATDNSALAGADGTAGRLPVDIFVIPPGAAGRPATGAAPAVQLAPSLDPAEVAAHVLEFQVGTTTVLATAVDSSGLTVTSETDACLTTVIVVDREPPVLRCPGNIRIRTDPGKPFGTLAPGDVPRPFVRDNADQNPLVKLIKGPAYNVSPSRQPALEFSVEASPHELVYTATDSSLNEATCSFAVTAYDAEPPVAPCVETSESNPFEVQEPGDPRSAELNESWHRNGAVVSARSLLTADVTDNLPGVVRLEVRGVARQDGRPVGVKTMQSPRGEAEALIQPGLHLVEVLAIDITGLVGTCVLYVRCYPAPTTPTTTRTSTVTLSQTTTPVTTETSTVTSTPTTPTFTGTTTKTSTATTTPVTTPTTTGTTTPTTTETSRTQTTTPATTGTTTATTTYTATEILTTTQQTTAAVTFTTATKLIIVDNRAPVEEPHEESVERKATANAIIVLIVLVVLVIITFVGAAVFRGRGSEELPPPGYLTFTDPTRGGIRGIAFGKRAATASGGDELVTTPPSDDPNYTVLYNWTAPPISGNGKIAQGTWVYQGPTGIDGQDNIWAVGVATGSDPSKRSWILGRTPRSKTPWSGAVGQLFPGTILPEGAYSQTLKVELVTAAGAGYLVTPERHNRESQYSNVPQEYSLLQRPDGLSTPGYQPPNPEPIVFQTVSVHTMGAPKFATPIDGFAQGLESNGMVTVMASAGAVVLYGWFASPDEMPSLPQSIRARYGLQLAVSQQGVLVIAEVDTGSVAESAGVRVGDILLAVNKWRADEESYDNYDERGGLDDSVNMRHEQAEAQLLSSTAACIQVWRKSEESVLHSNQVGEVLQLVLPGLSQFLTMKLPTQEIAMQQVPSQPGEPSAVTIEMEPEQHGHRTLCAIASWPTPTAEGVVWLESAMAHQTIEVKRLPPLDASYDADRSEFVIKVASPGGATSNTPVTEPSSPALYTSGFTEALGQARNLPWKLTNRAGEYQPPATGGTAGLYLFRVPFAADVKLAAAVRFKVVIPGYDGSPPWEWELQRDSYPVITKPNDARCAEVAFEQKSDSGKVILNCAELDCEIFYCVHQPQSSPKQPQQDGQYDAVYAPPTSVNESLVDPARAPKCIREGDAFVPANPETKRYDTGAELELSAGCEVIAIAVKAGFTSSAPSTYTVIAVDQFVDAAPDPIYGRPKSFTSGNDATARTASTSSVQLSAGELDLDLKRTKHNAARKGAIAEVHSDEVAGHKAVNVSDEIASLQNDSYGPDEAAAEAAAVAAAAAAALASSEQADRKRAAEADMFTTSAPAAANVEAAPETKYDSLKRFALIRLCKTRGVDYKPVAKDADGLRSLLIAADAAETSNDDAGV